MSFYRFHTTLLLLVFALVLNSQNIIVTPYLQNGSADSMTIMWETNSANDGFVDWGPDAFSLNNTVLSTTKPSDDTRIIHTAVITGLTANTKYAYRVRTTTGTTSNIYTFKTHPTKASEEDVNFVAISDMQRDNTNGDVFEAIVDLGIIPTANANYVNGIEDIEAILIPGDLVPTGGIYNHWRSFFFAPSDGITPYIPTYPIPGNHEYFGGGLPLFLNYFDLPLNGTGTNPEEWWYKDISNVRVVGLNSNSPAADLATQLTWLQTVLDDAGTDTTIDFVFAQLHHPYKSELWVLGEKDFTGDIIGLLESFSTTYGKPSIHLFGHTHSYSRGQSRDHNHLWVNVATAGGSIDYWGEFPNADYEEFVISEDEYGFVMLEVEAGSDPKFVLKRYSQGDINIFKNNTLSDEITIKRFDTAPDTPTGISPVGNTPAHCTSLKASAFSNGINTHQATHWQIVEGVGCDFNSTDVIDIWKQNTNWYNEVNTQLNDDLTDDQINSLKANTNYCWRVRYRNSNLTWSAWSTPVNFTTTTNYITSNLILNPGAESGITNWTGDIESIPSGGCGGVPTAFQGANLFAVGGVCANEQAIGLASQDLDVSAHAVQIDTGNYFVEFSGYLRGFSNNNDLPEMYVECLDASNMLLGTSPIISNDRGVWSLKTGSMSIPISTRTIRAFLKGTRLGGTDNDSYFDDISVRLLEESCPTLSSANSPDSNLKNNIKIFPNPATDRLNYISHKTFEAVSVTNMLGQIISETKFTGKSNFIDISNLNEGVYIITFTANNKKQHFKFIKNN